MEAGIILELVKALGAPGLVVGFMIWDRVERNKLDGKRSEADLEMARGLTAMGKDFQHLAELIRGRLK